MSLGFIIGFMTLLALSVVFGLIAHGGEDW